jgi:hypothetical protein
MPDGQATPVPLVAPMTPSQRQRRDVQSMPYPALLNEVLLLTRLNLMLYSGSERDTAPTTPAVEKDSDMHMHNNVAEGYKMATMLLAAATTPIRPTTLAATAVSPETPRSCGIKRARFVDSVYHGSFTRFTFYSKRWGFFCLFFFFFFLFLPF